MITRRTRLQLIAFAVITLLGVSYVGARYAQLDRLVVDDSYTVAATFADSGGIFAGAEVTYRGVTVGRVDELRLNDDGVDAMLKIDNGAEPIPADTRAVVGNRSAVGEQYVELQPETDAGPFLEDGSTIPVEMTEIPISSTKLLTSTSKLAESVDKQDLKTVVSELGQAFVGTGDDLGQIIDTSTSFIETANANFDLTQALIEDSNVVLGTQLDKASAIRSFARDLSLLSDTLVTSDKDLRRVIANGGATATELRTFLEENEVDLAGLINNLVTTGEVTTKYLPAQEMLLVVYPYIIAGAYVVIDESDNGLLDAHFGLVLNETSPVCREGYESTDRRIPQNGENRPLNVKARCTEPQAQSNARGAQNVPRVAPSYDERVLGTYDRDSRSFSFADQADAAASGGTVSYTGGASSILGEESWKWLLLQPLQRTQE